MDNNKNSVASTIIFSEFCKLLDDIKSNPKQAYKESKLKKFIENYRSKGKQLTESNPKVETSFYPILRLLLPRLERERGPYGLKEHGFAKTIINILRLPSKGEDATILNKFLSTTTANDFADAAYGVLRKHFSGSKGLTVSDINEHLDIIAKKNSENNIRGQEDEIFKLFKLTSPSEQKWIIRIILKEMCLIMGHNRILRSYHPDAVELFDNNNSLSKTCDILYDPSIRSNEIEISLFTPFRPMLSQRCDAKEFLKSVTGNSKFFIETKFDGERFQLHMKDGNFKYFSRNGYEYTKNYGPDYNSGTFTPLLKCIFKSTVQSVILDGEMMGWNTAKKKFVTQAMNFDVKKLTDTNKIKPCFCAFDVIFLNNVICTNKPLKERMQLLESVFSPVEGVMVLSEKLEAKTKEEVLNALNFSMDKGEEGIIFKNPESSYIPNDRKSGWWKMKLEYFSNVMSDLDVIIMGGCYGKGKKLSNGFIVGVAVPSRPGENPTKFLSLARIASGLNAEELESIDRKLGPHWKNTVNENCEDYGLYFGKDKPDVWIEPEKSCILHVRGSELLKLYGSNPDFKAGYTLRFPRIQSLRFDKPYYDCLTSAELDELTMGAVRLYKRHLELTDIEYEGRKLKRRKARFQAEDSEVAEVSNDILQGYEFCVLTGTQEWKKLDVEKVIKENGGSTVKMEGDNTFCILVGDTHGRTQYYKGSVDMVKLSWLQKVLNEQKFLIYKPEDMIYTSPKALDRFMTEYDKYGDSYTEKATKDSLELAFHNILKNDDYIHPMPSEIDTFHEDVDFPYQFGLFRDCLAYFDRHKVINEPQSAKIFTSVLEEVEFKFWGGTVSDYLTPEVDLVVTNSDNEQRFEEIYTYLGEIHNRNAKVVTKMYVSEQVLEYKNQ